MLSTGWAHGGVDCLRTGCMWENALRWDIFVRSTTVLGFSDKQTLYWNNVTKLYLQQKQICDSICNIIHYSPLWWFIHDGLLNDEYYIKLIANTRLNEMQLCENLKRTKLSAIRFSIASCDSDLLHSDQMWKVKVKHKI